MILIAAFVTCIILQKKGYYKKVPVVLYFAGISGSIICSYLLGWNSGFYYYQLLIILSCFYVPFFNRSSLFTLSTISFMILIATYLLLNSSDSYYFVTEFSRHIYFTINLSCFTGAILFVPLAHNRATKMTMKTISTTLAKNAELERLSKLKDDFLANTSHELRTPLHGISGIAESLCYDATVRASPFLKNNLEHIISSARRLTTLVNDILDFSKMRHNDLTINIQPLDIIQTIKSVLPNFFSIAAQKNIHLTTDVPDTLPLVLADEDRLIQILFNLIGNAVKFTDSGQVTVKVRQAGNEMHIQIIDTGIGIDQKDRDIIFDAFEQASFTPNDYRGGTGLGLAITKKIVELHKGKIFLTSEVGNGSIFTFTLPICTSRVIPDKLNTSASVHKAIIFDTDIIDNDFHQTCDNRFEYKKHTILVIDDEPINLQIVRNHLEPLGMKVVITESSSAIMEMIETHSPSVVLLDIMMPGRNGYECCSLIREKYSIIELPIVFISAKNRISDLVLGFDAGGNDYVLKPFLRKELIARVEAQIHQREAIDALKEISRLKADLADRFMEEKRLQQIQERLVRLLHSVDDGLIVTDEQGMIVFVNAILLTTLGYSDESKIDRVDISNLIHEKAYQRNLLTAKLSSQKYTPVLFSSADGNALDLYVKRLPTLIGEEQLFVFVIQPQSVKFSGAQSNMSDWIFSELEKNQERITELEQLSAQFGASNKKLIEQLTVTESPKTDSFTLGNKIMINTIALWKEATGKEKCDFAEASGLWKVHPDEDGWQRTITLDKYLDFRKMPKFPRWITIIQSARFVIKEIEKCKYVTEKTIELERQVKELETFLKGKTVEC
jgi:two-component system, sensor histidine kinase ChiS